MTIRLAHERIAEYAMIRTFTPLEVEYRFRYDQGQGLVKAVY